MIAMKSEYKWLSSVSLSEAQTARYVSDLLAAAEVGDRRPTTAVPDSSTALISLAAV
jgi:hypothetical protein